MGLNFNEKSSGQLPEEDSVLQVPHIDGLSTLDGPLYGDYFSSQEIEESFFPSPRNEHRLRVQQQLTAEVSITTDIESISGFML